MTVEGELQLCEDIWIVDLATLTHIDNSNMGLYNVRPIHEPIKIGDGKLVYTTKVGQLEVTYKAYKGKNEEFVLENISINPASGSTFLVFTMAITKSFHK